MKLSMWMIANQVSELDVKLEIREEAPAILNSARLAYATNCVHIYKEQDYVVCDGEGDRILFYDMDVTRVAELVQAIFDAHEDWISEITCAVQQQDYQTAMDLAYKLFKNPIVLFDANNKVLGLTSIYGENALDGEWTYINRYGYSSANAVNMFKYYAGSRRLYSKDKIRYELHNKLIDLGGITYCIYFKNIVCGRINLIAKERKLNAGDEQLLKRLVDVLQPVMGQALLYNPIFSTNNVFLNLMLDKVYDPNTLEIQLKYMDWKEQDVYYVTVVHLEKEEQESETADRQLHALMQILAQNVKHVVLNVWEQEVILLSTKNLAEEYDMQQLFRNLVVHNPVRIGFSLPNYNGIHEISKFFRQALYALERGRREPKGKKMQYFETYAAEFLLTADVPKEDKVMACKPGILQLWKEKQKGDDMFQTLLCFLDHERSIAQTSAELFMHRNTAVYRIKKIQESMHLDLNDVTVRWYSSLSMHFLDALEKEKDHVAL